MGRKRPALAPPWWVPAAGLALGIFASIARGAALEVRPVVPPPDAAHPARAIPRGAAVMTPDEMRIQGERFRRWRETPHFLPPKSGDWAARSKGRSAAGRAAQASGTARRPGPANAANGVTQVRLAMVRIDFATDRGGSRSTGNGRFDLVLADTVTNPVDRTPHDRAFYQSHIDALGRYYIGQSYGRVQITGDVWPRDANSAYTVSDMADFGPWLFSRDIYPQALHMFRTFLFAADSQAFLRGDRIPWEDYDAVVLVHAGGDLQSDIRQDSPEDIPTFTMGADSARRVFFHYGAVDTTGAGCDPNDPETPCFSIDRALFIPETTNQDDFYGTLNGVIAHETGHLVFGLDDVYNWENGFPVVGFWSLMDSGNLVGTRVLMPNGNIIFATGLLPPSIDPWQRYYVGDALYFPEASLGDTIDIEDSERHPDIPKVSLSSDEYLLLENRYIQPANLIQLKQDPQTRVVLGPLPDSLLYDALLPGGGVLTWHIDTSVIPFTTSLRVNEDFGYNTNPARPAISVLEADGLADLGDSGSPYALGAPSDPWFKAVNPTLSDSTFPNLIPHTGTRPHVRIDYLGAPDTVMQVSVNRSWQLPGWPVFADFPPGGPRPLAIDADGARGLEVCWAGGADSIVVGGIVVGNPDSAALFAVRADGDPLTPLATTYAFARLDRRPRPLMAAIALNDVDGSGAPGPAWFAVSTFPAGADTSFAGGRVFLVDTLGEVRPGWPPLLPTIVTTPPVIAGAYPNAVVLVGCQDGLVYALGLDGGVLARAGPVPGGVSGRLAVDWSLPGSAALELRIAAGGANGDVAVHDFSVNPGGPPLLGLQAPGWVRRIGASGFAPDFLWLNFDGAATPAGRAPVCADAGGAAAPALVVHEADRLWAFCSTGNPIPGWGRSVGDTLVDALGAGDPDGDGFPEVLTQTLTSKLTFWNSSGYPSPGWPKPGTREGFRTTSPPLSLDADGDGRSDVVALNASGILTALRADGRIPPGWPLATGVGCAGDVLAADLDFDGTLDLIGPDRFDRLYAYSLPGLTGLPQTAPWTMVGGDPARTSTLPAARATSPPAAAAGPLVSGSLKAYPNPARRKPVSFAFQLTEPAQVEFRILDTSGHEVASFARSGIQSDNLAVWDPGNLPAGMYLARIRFRGTGSERVEVVPVGVLR